jgi:hypothetical protein
MQKPAATMEQPPLDPSNHVGSEGGAQPGDRRASRPSSSLAARIQRRLRRESPALPTYTDADLNRVQLTGTLGSEPLLVDVGDHPVAFLALACTRQWTDPDGTPRHEITWISLRAWEERAEQCGRLLHHGDRVYVEGRLQLWSELRGGMSCLCHAVDLERIVLLAAGPRPDARGGG